MKALIALIVLCSATPALAQQMQTVTPNYGGGYTIRNPYNPSDTTIVTPSPGGGYTARNPYDPNSYTTINPTPGGGYTVNRPFGGNPYPLPYR